MTFLVSACIVWLAAVTIAPAGEPAAAPGAADYARWSSPRIRSLDDLSIPALRARRYGSALVVLERLGGADAKGDRPGPPRHRSGVALLAQYRSDGNLVYTRIDVPSSPPPPGGYPVVVFLHGWYPNEDAPGFDFAADAGSLYGRVIEAFTEAGFLVAYPGWRGYGTVQGRPADGAGFLEAWNNASYLMPVFFAIDVLNLLDSLDSLESTDWREWGFPGTRAVRIDRSSIHIAGHSQGGDAVLMVLAVSGEGSRVRNAIASGSIWAGCFASRFRQLETYAPMQRTAQAFLSGDGTWNGTARGDNGAVNPNFVFGWPPDSVEGVRRGTSPSSWGAGDWPLSTVADALRMQYAEMYAALNRNVGDLGAAKVAISEGADGRVVVRHDPVVARQMAAVGGGGFPEYLSEPLALHFSDQDYYSPPEWNEDLARRVNAAGGHAAAFVYPGNTHALMKSHNAWYSGPDVTPGFGLMLRRDIALFRGLDTGPGLPAGK